MTTKPEIHLPATWTNADKVYVVKQIRQLMVERMELLVALEKLANELQVWYSSGDPRPASWAEKRIARARAVLARAKGE